jgi:hypothetical protein
MSTLGKITDEYFGKTTREEDLMPRPDIDSLHPTRDLTPDEWSFLSALSDHILFFDRSLFFQVNDLRRHTRLVLSGMGAKRSEFPRPDELLHEINELKKLIEKLGPQDEALRKLLEKQLEELEKAFKNRRAGVKTTILLGEYRHHNGHDSEVILYVNNIEHFAAHDPLHTKYLMGQVLLHEYFHSFYHHAGIAMRDRLPYVEEPIAEYGSLVALDSVATSRSPRAADAANALTYTINFVKDKQKGTGLTPAYGFGAYLFDNHKKHYRDLISVYANVSLLLNEHAPEALAYKYMVYPTYPFSLEHLAYKKMRDLLTTALAPSGGAHASATAPSPTPAKRATTKLRVSFPGGMVISERSAAQTFAKCIEHIGPLRVRALGLILNNVPLVSNTLDMRYNRSQIPVTGGLYVMTHSNTKQKAQLLEEISDLLHLNLKVEII